VELCVVILGTYFGDFWCVVGCFELFDCFLELGVSFVYSSGEYLWGWEIVWDVCGVWTFCGGVFA